MSAIDLAVVLAVAIAIAFVAWAHTRSTAQKSFAKDFSNLSERDDRGDDPPSTA
jgi:hypothetical protein